MLHCHGAALLCVRKASGGFDWVRVFCCCSVTQSCPTLCNPMDCSVPGFPVLYQLLELTQTHVHDESVMPYNHLILCHSLLLPHSIFPSIRLFSNESVLCIRWQGIGVSASASVLPMNIQDWYPLGWTSWISLQSKGRSRVFSNTAVQKHQFFDSPLVFIVPFSSVQFSHSIASDSLRPCESQHARPPCPSPTPRVHSNSWPSSRWCHPTISSSVALFSSCLQSFPASRSFPMISL